MYPSNVPHFYDGSQWNLSDVIVDRIAIYLSLSWTIERNRSLSFFDLVPEAGIEPARGYPRGILSPLRLPIPPSGQLDITYVLEAEVGIEPASTALQAAA